MEIQIISDLIKMENDATEDIKDLIYSSFCMTVNDLDLTLAGSLKHDVRFVKDIYKEYLLACCTLFLQYIEDLGDGAATYTAKKEAKAGLADKFNPNHVLNAEENEYFQYIGDMLDLDNKSVCTLLPYLLAAYTCHSIKNRLGKSDTRKLLLGHYDEDDEHEQNISRRKKQIDKLSKKFSFADYTVSVVNAETEMCSAVPLPAVANRSNASKMHHDTIFVNHIFAVWFVIIRELASSEKYKNNPEIQEVLSNIKLKHNYLLFLHQTKQNIPSNYDLTPESDESAYDEKVYEDFLFTYRYISI